MKQKLKIALVIIVAIVAFVLVWYINKRSNQLASIPIVTDKIGQEASTAETVSGKNETIENNTEAKTSHNINGSDETILPSRLIATSIVDFKTKRNATGELFAEPMLTKNHPDVDLHAITEDGKHIGVNYNTGEYEIQVGASRGSLNTPGGGPEWIYMPDNIKASYYFDITPLKKWADEVGVEITEIKTEWDISIDDENGDRTRSKSNTISIDPQKNITPIVIPADIKLFPPNKTGIGPYWPE